MNLDDKCEVLNTPLTNDEVTRAILKLNSGKAPGLDITSQPST